MQIMKKLTETGDSLLCYILLDYMDGIIRYMSSQAGLNPVDQSSALYYHDREMDIMEEFVGGRRYEMVELPDSLVETTLFVGNLCEFVTDEMLSAIFQQASSLNFIPACVCRKPNSSSLKYGFVTFPTVAEKEVGIFILGTYRMS